MYNYTLNDIAYLADKSHAEKIYLHWSASPYDHVSEHYHLNINDKGEVFSHHDNFDIKLSHTWRRNSNAIGITIACMSDGGYYGGENVDWGTYPPTEAQMNAIAQVVACICKAKGWQPTYDIVKTHAEAANEDGYGPEQTCERWDLWIIPNGKAGEGGNDIRGNAAFYMDKI